MKMPNSFIREEILKSGTISFARFMELALYCPETGYYEANKDIIGHRGDFITSVSTGSLFGELLAWQFAEWLEELATAQAPALQKRWQIVEAGAHGGQLAKDILSWLQPNRPRLYNGIDYVIVEPSQCRRRWQEESLKGFADKVRWVPQLSDLSLPQSICGLIFSNELLDAFPVRRFGWEAAKKDWFEWGVTVKGGNFCWDKIEHPPAGIPKFCPPDLEQVLPDGYIVETSPAAEKWWREAAGMLSHGKLLTIDYGYAADEMFSPGRHQGTLRAYYRHHVTQDLLANPGGQDLTAHVNFIAIQEAGEAAGLRTEHFCTQPQFLTRILQKSMAEKAFANQMNLKQARQFQTLTHPEHLGRAFRVLVQAR